jgi:hypothetical protein
MGRADAPEWVKFSDGFEAKIGLGHLQPGVEEWVHWMVTGTQEDCADLEVFVMDALGYLDSMPASVHVCFEAWHPRLVAIIDEGHWQQGAPTPTHSGRPKYYQSKTFSVRAEVCNEGDEPAHDVYAELVIGDGITLVDDFHQKYLGKELMPSECREVKWTLHCEGGAPGGTLETIEVIPSGNNDITGEPITNIEKDSTTVYQFPREHIAVTGIEVEEVHPSNCGPVLDEIADNEDKNGIVTTDMERVGTSTCYSVTAYFHNDGYADLLNLVAELEYYATNPGGENHLEPVETPPFKRYLDELHQDGTWHASWLFHCPEGADTLDEDGRYQITFKVDVMADSEICDESVEDEKEWTITQKDLIVDITTPVEPFTVAYGFGDDTECFTVHADIYNRELLEESLTELYAQIILPAGMELHSSTPEDKVDLIQLWDPGDPDLAANPSKDSVEWMVCCTGEEDGVIEVYAQGKSSPSSKPYNNHDLVYVNQISKAHLVATFTSPEPLTWFGLGEIFQVTAEVENTGESGATNVETELTITSGNAQVVGDPVRTGLGTQKWYVQCTGPCPVTMHVQPSGEDETAMVEIPGGNLDGDDLTVHQSPLELVIYDIPRATCSRATPSASAPRSRTCRTTTIATSAS